MGRVYEEVLRKITQDYLDTIDADNPPSPNDIQEDILNATEIEFITENGLRPKQSRWRIPQKLEPKQIAQIVMKLYHVVNIAYGGLDADKSYDMLSVYQTEGPNRGIYVADSDSFYDIIQQYSYAISDKNVTEVLNVLRNIAPRVERNNTPNLVAINNGIFNYDTKELFDFSPDYVFVAKSCVDYNPNAKNVVIHNDEDGTDWDVESWMDDLFDGNKDMSNLIWQIIGAIIRPNVAWNKSAWFYSEQGNNGKGTLCELMRQITGKGTYATIPLSDMGKDFMLEPLIHATSIIVDENDVGLYIDKAANLKAIITGDSIKINRKFKTPVSYKFKGFMVQCLNEMPRIRDKSESFYRRQIFISFKKCFTGTERKYIKNDYLKRKDVLEYVLYKVLNMNYYELSEPDECKLALQEYKQFNDPVREFFAEFSDRFVWDLVPYDFLYDLYKAWYKDSFGNSQNARSKMSFTKDLKQLVTKEYSDTWKTSDNIRVCTRMDKPEILIYDYDLDKWKNKITKGNDILKMCIPNTKDMYRGLLRA